MRIASFGTPTIRARAHRRACGPAAAGLCEGSSIVPEALMADGLKPFTVR
jgi:hypothetical protein